MGRKAKYEPMIASKKKKPPKAPSIEAVCRRAGELGMTYGLYVQSPQYIIDTADDGYFNKKRGKKNADKA
jgi:hypothetical protein|nr:MAG TPA: hypothetical protein [Caudoviricetes sp.]